MMAICCLLVVAGCPRRPGTSIRFDEADLKDPEALYLEILGHGEQIRTLQGTARLSLQMNKEKASLDAVIACDREGRLRFEVLDWLNHVVFLALFDKKGFLTYSVPDNQYAAGPDDPARIQEILGIPLTAEELVSLALGDPFFLPITDPILSLSVDQGALLLDAGPPSLGPRYRVWLDEQKRPERMFVLRPYQDRRAVGDLQVDYGKYRQVGSVVFPHRIRVAATASHRVLQVDYQKVLLNESLEEDLFEFEPPEDAVRSMR
jgi:hypothetical protein